jgi:hypothetical protein
MGEDDDLDPVAEVELLEEVGDVRLHRRLADVELLSDLRVRQAPGDEAKNVSLAGTELVELCRGASSSASGSRLRS